MGVALRGFEGCVADGFEGSGIERGGRVGGNSGGDDGGLDVTGFVDHEREHHLHFDRGRALWERNLYGRFGLGHHQVGVSRPSREGNAKGE